MRYEKDEDVDPRWYLEHGWPDQAAEMLARPGATLTATDGEWRVLKPLIEEHGVTALYFDGTILVFTHTEAAELLRELELQEGRRGPLPASPGQAARMPRSVREKG
jgi:hypothetical protein